MPILAPRSTDFPKIRRSLVFYKVCAYITGVMLLLLCTEMVVKYVFGHVLYFGSSYGPIALVPNAVASGAVGAQALPGFDVSTGVLIAHGWLYVLYLFSVFYLWSLMRWRAPLFIALALGGVVPFLSFIVEGITSRRVRSYIAGREESDAVPGTPVATATASASARGAEASH